MDFLDSLDFQTNKRTNRVRSWYLYEQFKSLESNQLEAVRKLKNRYHQEKALRRELSERKARRALCDQYDRSRTASRVASSVRSVETTTSLDASNEDFLEKCYQLEDEQTLHDEQSTQDELSEHGGHELAVAEDSQDDSIGNRSNHIKSLADLDDSINSVVENLKDSENITDEIKEELEFVRHGIAENISLQLEAAKENIQCLEEFSEFCEDCKLSEKEYSVQESKQSVRSNFEEETKGFVVPKQDKNCIYDNTLVAVWMKLVSFAYQVIKLNHGGNCYCDYSSQFLTAVLACDVIRRGFSRLCDILQPYVCPIVYFEDETHSSASCYKNPFKKIDNTKKSYNTFDFEPCSPRSIGQQHRKPACKRQCCNKKYKAEDILNPKCKCFKKYDADKYSINKSKCYSRKYYSQSFSKYSAENRNSKKRTASAPCPSVGNVKCACRKPSKTVHTHSTLWPTEFDSENLPRCGHCPRRARLRNPMLKIANYIDEILVHTENL